MRTFSKYHYNEKTASWSRYLRKTPRKEFWEMLVKHVGEELGSNKHSACLDSCPVFWAEAAWENSELQSKIRYLSETWAPETKSFFNDVIKVQKALNKSGLGKDLEIKTEFDMDIIDYCEIEPSGSIEMSGVLCRENKFVITENKVF